jgi:hypothetical protein
MSGGKHGCLGRALLSHCVHPCPCARACSRSAARGPFKRPAPPNTRPLRCDLSARPLPSPTRPSHEHAPPPAPPLSPTPGLALQAYWAAAPEDRPALETLEPWLRKVVESGGWRGGARERERES